MNLSKYKVSPLNMIFLINDDHILTLKRNPDKKIYPNKLSGFGGKVEPNETLEKSVQREFLEETGLTLLDAQLRGTFIRILKNVYINELYLFVATKASGELKERSDEGTIKWLKVDNFLKSPDIVDHIPFYLEKIIEGKDFYCGLGKYENDSLVEYVDNSPHFDKRRR